MEHYNLKLCGFSRQLPIIKIGPKFSIASFSLLGDIDLVEVAATELVERIKYLDFDYLVGSEIKVLPLIYQMSHLLGQKKYVILRKKVLGYMTKPFASDGQKPLVLNGPDADLLQDKKVIFISDVVATGRTVKEAEGLMEKIKTEIVAVASVLKQGEPLTKINQPFFYLQTIPLFSRKDQNSS